MEDLLKKTLMDLKKMYFDYQDKVREFKRKWSDICVTNSQKNYDVNVMSALIYFYKQCGMDSRLLNKYLGNNKINNDGFGVTMKAYITKDYVQKFISDNAYLDDDFLLGVAFFYDEQKLYREDGAREDNESLNTLLEELLGYDSLDAFSFLQGNANPGRILVDIASKIPLLNYTAYAMEPDRMVVLQLRALLLQRIQEEMTLGGIVQPKSLVENKLFDRILTMPIWRPSTKVMERFPERPSISELGIPESKVNDGEWQEILFNFSLLERKGKMVTLVTNSTLANSLNSNIREYLVKNGLIETIIELPDRLLEYTGIDLYAVVLS